MVKRFNLLAKENFGFLPKKLQYVSSIKYSLVGKNRGEFVYQAL